MVREDSVLVAVNLRVRGPSRSSGRAFVASVPQRSTAARASWLHLEVAAASSRRGEAGGAACGIGLPGTATGLRSL